MPRVLQLSSERAEHDPRARRAEAAAYAAGVEMTSVSLGTGGRAPLPRRLPRELRGTLRLARFGATTLAVLRKARESGRHRPRPDIVHAHDLEMLVAGSLIAGVRRSRLVYDAHELYTGFDQDPPKLWLAVIRRLEGALARRAGAVVTVSDEIADTLVRLHGLHARPHVVLNAPPLEDVEVVEHDGPVRAIYQAAAGAGRHLEDLPAVAGVEVHARVLGHMTAPPHVIPHPPLPPDELVQALAEFDIGLVIDRPETENARLALPNKFFEYLMAGLAVLVPRVPAMAALVEREGVGRAYEPGMLGEALAALAADRPALEAMRLRARQAAVERYNAEAQRPALYAAWGL